MRSPCRGRSARDTGTSRCSSPSPLRAHATRRARLCPGAPERPCRGYGALAVRLRASAAAGAAGASSTSIPRASGSTTPRCSSVSPSSRSRRRGARCGSAWIRSATCRQPASTRRGASSTSTTSAGAPTATGRSSTRWSTSAQALPRLRRRVARDLRRRDAPSRAGSRRQRPHARARARLRGAAARSRLLSHRLRGLRRAQRVLRADDDAARARDDRRRASSSSTFPAKSGQRRVQAIADRRRAGGRRGAQAPTQRQPAARLPRRRRLGRGQRRRGQRLHQAARRRRFTAKDFRTWNATVLAAVALAGARRGAGEPRAAREREVRAAITTVAAYLGNTPAVCRASYVDPRVIDRYHAGVTIAATVERLARHGTTARPRHAARAPARRGGRPGAASRRLNGTSDREGGCLRSGFRVCVGIQPSPSRPELADENGRA